MTRAGPGPGSHGRRGGRRPGVTLTDFAADDTYGLTRVTAGVWAVTARGAPIGQVRREHTPDRRSPRWQAWSPHQIPIGAREPTRARAALHLVQAHRDRQPPP